MLLPAPVGPTRATVFPGKICRLIPPIKFENMRIARLYVGNEGTGSHIHNHSAAVNFLVHGLKVWILFPKTDKNTQFLRRNNILYGEIKENPLEWFERNEKTLTKNLEKVEIKLQQSGEVFLVPENYYHGVYNLTNVCGITYSWF